MKKRDAIAVLHMDVPSIAKHAAIDPTWPLQCLSTPTPLLIPLVLSRTRGICFGSMASSAKRRAVGMGENPVDSEDNSSDEGLEDDGDSGENESGSEEEINEVRYMSVANWLHSWPSRLASTA